MPVSKQLQAVISVGPLKSNEQRLVVAGPIQQKAVTLKLIRSCDGRGRAFEENLPDLERVMCFVGFEGAEARVRGGAVLAAIEDVKVERSVRVGTDGAPR